jgi:hypothetical protein
MKRRTNAEIAEIERLHDAAMDEARAIDARIGLDDTPIVIRAANIYGVRADYQREIADELVVTFRSKDAVVIERVARAIKAALATTTTKTDFVQKEAD